jgi:hypothetical protein
MDTYTIHYQSTLDEAVETLTRLAKHLGYQKKQLIISLVTPLLVCGLLFVVLDSSMKYLLITTAFIVSILVILFTFKPMMNRQLKKSAIQFRGTDQPVDASFTLTPQGILFHLGGQQIQTNWQRVTTLTEDRRFFEIIAANPLVCILIPKNAIPENDVDRWRTFITNQIPPEASKK